MTRVVLINPPSDVVDNPVPPLGALAIASYVDAQVDDVACEVLHLERGTLGEALRHVDSSHWENVTLIGPTLMSMDVRKTCEVAARARAHTEGALVSAGGPHAILAWQDFLTRHAPPFDLCVVGEGERSISLGTTGRPDRFPLVIGATAEGPSFSGPWHDGAARELRSQIDTLTYENG